MERREHIVRFNKDFQTMDLFCPICGNRTIALVEMWKRPEGDMIAVSPMAQAICWNCECNVLMVLDQFGNYGVKLMRGDKHVERMKKGTIYEDFDEKFDGVIL